MSDPLSSAPENPAKTSSFPTLDSLPPPDADPAADAESRRIAKIIERDFEKGFPTEEDRAENDRNPRKWVSCVDYRPERLGLSWEELLDPRVLAWLRPETICRIRDLWGAAPNWLWERAAHFRGPCPAWVRSLIVEAPKLLPVVWDKVRDDAGIRRVLAALSWKLPGKMPRTLREDVKADAYGRFAIHATMCGFHWSPGGVAALAEIPASPAFFGNLLEHDEEFARRFPPEKLLPIFLRISRVESRDKRDSPSKILPLLERLETLRPGAIRACSDALGGGNLLRRVGRAEEAAFLIEHGADPDAPDFTGIPGCLRMYCDEWYRKWRKVWEKQVFYGKKETPPPFQPPEVRTSRTFSGPQPFPPGIIHPFTRLVLFDGRPAAIAADLRAHRGQWVEYLREAKFRNLLGSPRVLREAGPELAREMLFPYGHNMNAKLLRGIFEILGANAAIWAERLGDPDVSRFVRTYRWLVSRLGRRTLPTRAGRLPGVRFPPKEGETTSDTERLRWLVAWASPYTATTQAERLSAGFPTFVAWAELGTAPGAGLLWVALMPRLEELFQASSPCAEKGKVIDKTAVGRLLGTLARLGADPDVPTPDGITPRQVAETLAIPVKW